MIEIGVGVFIGAVEGVRTSCSSSCRRDRRSRLSITAVATSSTCTAPFQNQRAQSLYLAYTVRSQYGINPAGAA
jgi:hypothetical protein